MATITDKLNKIKNAKESIKSSIEAKGVEVGDVSIEEYSSKIDKLNTVNFEINNASYLFYSGARKEIMEELFALCKNVTTTYNMCSSAYLNNSDVVQMNKLDTNKVASMARTFYSAGNFDTLDISEWDASSVNNVDNFLKYTSTLRNFKFMKNLGKGYTQTTNNYSNYKLDLSSSTNLTHDSLMSVINNLYDLNLTYDVANGGTLYTQQLVLGSTNMARLTAEEIAICTAKGWSVS